MSGGNWNVGDRVISRHGTKYKVTSTHEDKKYGWWVRMINDNDCETSGDQATYEEVGFYLESNSAQQ
jgi:hypothetical protein